MKDSGSQCDENDIFKTKLITENDTQCEKEVLEQL